MGVEVKGVEGNRNKGRKPISKLCLQKNTILTHIVCVLFVSDLGEEAEGDGGKALPHHPQMPSMIHHPWREDTSEKTQSLSPNVCKEIRCVRNRIGS